MGIKALEMQLSSGEVTVPDIPMVQILAVFALLQFNRSKYLFPERDFLYHVITAVILGADAFLGYIGDKLCLPTGRFD